MSLISQLLVMIVLLGLMAIPCIANSFTLDDDEEGEVVFTLDDDDDSSFAFVNSSFTLDDDDFLENSSFTLDEGDDSSLVLDDDDSGVITGN
ncbi:hypothetical protein JVU11DRAFT_9131 [Chiua virens]|nr:hypothetical protein JVU11DRAFT_9131 [Chiua virens]